MKCVFLKILLALILSNAALFAQSRPLDADQTEDYKKIIAEARQKLATVSYRVRSEKRASAGGFSGVNVKQIYEFIPPDRSSKMVETGYWTDAGEAEPGKTDRIIQFENKRFIKFDNEGWKTMTDTDVQKLINSSDNYFLEAKDYSFATGLKITKYAGRSKQIQIYRAAYEANKRFYEVFYHKNAQGFLLKTEWQIEYPQKYQMIMNEDYQYDANLKIELPKLN